MGRILTSKVVVVFFECCGLRLWTCKTNDFHSLLFCYRSSHTRTNAVPLTVCTMWYNIHTKRQRSVPHLLYGRGLRSITKTQGMICLGPLSLPSMDTSVGAYESINHENNINFLLPAVRWWLMWFVHFKSTTHSSFVSACRNAHIFVFRNQIWHTKITLRTLRDV